MPRASKFVSPILLGIAVPALLLAGFFHAYPIELFAAAEQTVVLDADQNAVTPRAGLSYYCDLANLSLASRADNAGSSPDLRVRFYENGDPLTHEIDHCRIETQPG